MKIWNTMCLFKLYSCRSFTGTNRASYSSTIGQNTSELWVLDWKWLPLPFAFWCVCLKEALKTLITAHLLHMAATHIHTLCASKHIQHFKTTKTHALWSIEQTSCKCTHSEIHQEKHTHFQMYWQDLHTMQITSIHQCNYAIQHRHTHTASKSFRDSHAVCICSSLKELSIPSTPCHSIQNHSCYTKI